MPLTWGDIKKWSPTTLDTAETNLKKDRRSMLDLADELETMGVPKQWHGDAAQTSRTKLKNVATDLKDIVAEVSTAYTAVCDAADAVRGVELAVDAAAEYAKLHSLNIEPDGEVTDVGDPIDTGNDHDDEIAKAERDGWVIECVDRIEQALRKANDVDTDLTAVLAKIELNRIHAGPGGLAAASKLGEVKGDLGLLEPPVGASISDSTAWWASLSPDERVEVIAMHPMWIGNRDGIDFTSRDLANRNILDDRSDYVNKRLKDPNLTDDEREVFEEQQKSIKLLRERMDKEGVHQLAGLDFSNGRTQAILSNGNMDTADQVAVFTPGMTSNVPGMGGYDSNMLDLKKRMEDILFAEGDTRPDGTPKEVATVTWMGYQAPGNPLDGDFSVASSSAAKEGGEDLANFYRGINSSRMTDPDLTALAHSYGSSTAGYALQHENTGVDRTVLFGSPGAATDNLDDFHTPRGSTYYAETSNDVVGDLGRFGPDPSGLDGMKHLETSDAEDAEGRPLERNRGHGEYLDDGTTSQYSIAEIAAGHEDKSIADDGQGPVRSLLDDVSDDYEAGKDELEQTLKEEYEEKKGWIKKGWDALT